MAVLNQKYYIGVKAGLIKNEIVGSVNSGSPYPGVWLVVISPNRIEQLDILDSYSYFSDKYEARRTEIVGIAIGRTEALEIVRDIADEVYRNRAAASIREYFAGNE